MIITVKKVLIFMWVTLLMLTYPFITIIYTIWYKFVTFLGVYVKKFESHVSGVDVFFTPDDFYKKPSATMIHIGILDETPDREIVFKDLNALFDEQNEDNSMRHEKLACSVENWMGYIFWKKVNEFKIQDRVHFLKDPHVNHENIGLFVESIIRKPFVRDEPLWDIYFISGGDTSVVGSISETKKQDCFVVFRTHHILLDGMTLVKLWFKADGLSEYPQDLVKFSTSSVKNASENESGLSSAWKKFWKDMKTYLLAPYLSNKIICSPRDQNVLTKTYKDFTGDWFCSGVHKIQLDKFRQPLRDLNFTLTHAVVVGYMRGFRRFIETHYGIECVPKRVHIMGSIPLPDRHPNDVLTNHWTIMRYKADLHTQSILEELEKAKGEYSRAVKDDPVPYSFSFMLELVRALPGKFYETMMETPNSGTLSMSNIPGPKDPLKMFGKNVKDRMIWLPLSMNNSGVALLFLTYNGWGNFAMTADSGCIRTRKVFQDLNKFVFEEMHAVLDEVVRLADIQQYSHSADSGELREVTVM